MTTTNEQLRSQPGSTPLLGIALDGAGWHPAAWREVELTPADLLTARTWVEQATLAAQAGADFITLEDSYGAPGAELDHHPGVAGRLDTVLVANAIAPLVPGIGIIATVVTTLTEPFHSSKAIATLDHVSGGRAGVQLRIGRPHEAALTGRRPASDYADLPGRLDEAAAHAQVQRLLWDSWEDDAEIRDVATGRFVDRDRLHYIDFQSTHFSVKGPSITPRPPQGQPVISALSHDVRTQSLLIAAADLGHVTPADPAQATARVRSVRDAEALAGRQVPLRLTGDLQVVLGATTEQATQRRAQLDAQLDRPGPSDAAEFTGTTADLVALIAALVSAGLDGVRLRPASLLDLRRLAAELPAAWQDAGLGHRTGTTFRERLGLDRPASRYAVA